MSQEDNAGRKTHWQIPKPKAPKVRSFKRREGGKLFSTRPLLLGLLVWSVYPLFELVRKGFMLAAAGGVGEWHQEQWLFIQRNVLSHGGGFLWMPGTFWFWTIILTLLTLVVMIAGDEDDTSGLEAAVIGFNAILLVVSIIGAIYSTGVSDRAYNQAMASNTTIVIPDLKHPPSSLDLVFNKQSKAPKKYSLDGKTVKIGDLATITQGTMPDFQWEPRTSSLSGAKLWMNNKVPARQGVDTWDDTLAYAYGKTEDTSRWTVILDGSGRTRGTYGIAEWRGGQQNVHTCTFEGANKLTRAFHGTNKNNMRNVIADARPGLFFHDEDVSGYCNANDKPVIVISMLRNGNAGVVTRPVPAGVLIITGQPSGFPRMEYRATVNPGDFPVPTYPMSLIKDQRDSIDWAAGRGNKDGANFGYEPSTFASQASNDGDYVLRNTKDGRIYAVTPSKFNKTKSQTYVLYQIIQVDHVVDRVTNDMRSYVVEDNGSSVNPALLDTDAHIYMGWIFRQASYTEFLPVTFFSDGGSIQEYVPLDNTLFRGYGIDKTGATRFYIDIDVTNKLNPLVTVLNIAAGSPVLNVEIPKEVHTIGTPGATLKPQVTITCDGKNAATASADALAACLQAYQQELIKRLQQNPTAPATPTPSVIPSPAPTR